MPVPVEYVCPECKGRTEELGTSCIPCTYQREVVNQFGYKHTVIKFKSAGDKRKD